jgi:hypothetical protein
VAPGPVLGRIAKKRHLELKPEEEDVWTRCVVRDYFDPHGL